MPGVTNEIRDAWHYSANGPPVVPGWGNEDGLFATGFGHSVFSRYRYAIVLLNAVLRKYRQQRQANLPTDQTFKELLLAVLLMVSI